MRMPSLRRAVQAAVDLVLQPRAQGNPLDDRYYELPGRGYSSAAGVPVTADSAMRVGAVYRCVSILANMLAMFPKGMYERLEEGRDEAPDHPLDKLISFAPNTRQTAFEFWRLVCFHLVLRQNAFVQIVQGQPGRGWVGQLVPLHPDRVYGPEELPSGRLRYEYRRPNGEKIKMLGGVDIWHLQGLSHDGLRGMSMIDIAADSIGVSAAAEKHAGRFFQSGLKIAGILQHPSRLKLETANEMGESFTRKWGGERGTGSVPVLWEGMTFQSVNMTAKDAEFLESRKFSVSEIARWFGVPPHMVGDVERSTSWGTGIEQQGLHFLIYSLQPWIELLEQSIRYTLVVQPERYYAKLNVNAILRMDAKAQADVFEILIRIGVLNPNECRELLERNPREGGDVYAPTAKTVQRAPQIPGRPQVAPPPEDDSAEDGPEESVRHRARALATSRATEILLEEGAELAKLAKKHAKNDAAWRSAAAGFYGRFVGRVAAAMVLPEQMARTWCESRREHLLTGGLADLLRVPDAAVTLAELALMEEAC